MTRRADALFDLSEAALCADGPVRSVAELSLAGEHLRGHGSGYAAWARGRMDVARLRTALTRVPLLRAADGRLVLGMDITSWLRPEAHTSPQQILCHTYGRGKDTHMMVPGWPYSVVVALETGRGSWTAPVDAVRLVPGMDAASVSARQIRDVVGRLTRAGQWRPGDPDILLVADAGYDGPRLAHVLADLPVTVLVRMRSRRICTAPVRNPRRTSCPRPGFGAGFGTCARSWPVRPVSRNPPGQAPADPTSNPRHAMTSTPSPARTPTKPSAARTPSAPARDPAEQDKTEARACIEVDQSHSLITAMWTVAS
ncbi:transposase [Kibdelosporangium aridum]|uniref:transposase n=1 Tax=Kibdelosporangium aridum TaxID=2030 RepID=UPI0021AD7747|nr:transposase [Kibdelosporangium aridum]